METAERAKSLPDIDDRKIGAAVGIAMSFTYSLLTVISETFHLTQRSTYFIADLDAAAWRVAGTYALFAVISGVVVGVLVRDRVRQSMILGVLYFTVVSLKVLWLDASILAVPKVAVTFGLFAVAFFVGAIVLASRLRLGPMFPVLLVIGYVNVALGIASGWGTSGGRLLAFLISPRTVGIIAAGALLVSALTFAQHMSERREAWWRRAAIPAGVALTLVVATFASASRFPTREGLHVDARPNVPDIYILSFDALRSDDLAAYVARRPDGHIARLVAQASTFDNVVSHGTSTDIILANHTFAGSARTCDGSLPRQLWSDGYFTAMIYAGLGRRIPGSVCYDYYFSGDGEALVSRFSVAGLATIIEDEALRYRQLRASTLLDKLGHVTLNPAPIYAYLHFLELHAPYVPEGKRHDARYLADIRSYMERCYSLPCDPASNRALIERARNAYLETFDEVDRAVGRARELAEARHRPYVMVVTADHGELFGEHDGFAHSGGFVPELLDIPYIVFDSRVPVPMKRCELMLSSEALRATATNAQGGTNAYPDRAVLEWAMTPLGTGRLNKERGTLDYVIAPKVREHAGTWRNVHRDARGSLSYPVSDCR